ncbi:MAG TPA: alkaline phosphatase family protein [Blastocatellia bacterium]|nr:alkaline phosphatase family protein [Blastocatellia bacterium]
MKPEILVIGLDAATMDLIEPWAGAGHLPTLARLIDEGVSARFLSTPNMHSASAWTSILTGLNPGRHGLYVFSDRDFATGRQLFFKGGDRAGDLITRHLARAGRTSGLLNVPMTYPAEASAGGFMISGLDAPSLNERAFCPPKLRDELLGRFPNYNFAPQAIGDLMSAGRITEAIEAWLELIETQTSAAEYLMEAHPVDFFMTVYTASDWGGHNLWKYSDSSHPSFDPEGAARHGNALLAIYRALDKAVARLEARAGDGAQLYVISDHGMGPHTGASYHLADWLESKGYMARKAGRPARSSLLKAGKQVAKAVLPAAVKEKIKSGLSADRMERIQSVERDSFYSSIDWRRTICYTEPGRHVININLAGRNAEGIVAPADYDRVSDELTRELMAWTDERGSRIVDRVARRDEVYRGPFIERASDLYLYWNRSVYLGEPPDEVRARGYWWSGDHLPEGILICKGRGIRADARLDSPVVYDLVPTILYLAGLPVPEGLDGRALEEASTVEFRAGNAVKIGSASTEQISDSATLSESEEKLIEEKLRGLGYM